MKTVIDLDEQLLRAARRALGTDTKKATVNAALAEVAALDARRRDLERLRAGLAGDLADRDARARAWQR